MPEKIGNGIGVPFAGLGLGGSGSGGLADGYYYQIDLADPRTASGWVSGPNLHNGSAGDTSLGYLASTSSSVSRIALLVAKAAGMTFDALSQSPGFAWTLTVGQYYGSNDLSAWTPVNFDGMAMGPPGSGSFQWWSNGVSTSNSTDLGPYKYLAWTLTDTGNVSQVGCADIRIKNDGSEVGP